MLRILEQSRKEPLEGMPVNCCQRMLHWPLVNGLLCYAQLSLQPREQHRFILEFSKNSAFRGSQCEITLLVQVMPACVLCAGQVLVCPGVGLGRAGVPDTVSLPGFGSLGQLNPLRLAERKALGLLSCLTGGGVERSVAR